MRITSVYLIHPLKGHAAGNHLSARAGFEMQLKGNWLLVQVPDREGMMFKVPASNISSLVEEEE